MPSFERKLDLLHAKIWLHVSMNQRSFLRSKCSSLAKCVKMFKEEPSKYQKKLSFTKRAITHQCKHFYKRFIARGLTTRKYSRKFQKYQKIRAEIFSEVFQLNHESPRNDTCIAQNLLKIKFTSNAFILIIKRFSIARYKNIPCNLFSISTECNTWETCALTQFAKFSSQSAKHSHQHKFVYANLTTSGSPLNHLFQYSLLAPLFHFRLPNFPLVFTHFPWALSIFLHLLTPYLSPCPIPLVHFGIDECYLSQ